MALQIAHSVSGSDVETTHKRPKKQLRCLQTNQWISTVPRFRVSAHLKKLRYGRTDGRTDPLIEMRGRI